MPTLVGVERTLLVPLYARAEEATKPHALVQDSHAAALLAALGPMVVPPALHGRTFGPVLRTWLFDRIVSRFLSARPDGTVVELGAGLNTRFERLDNGCQRWFDLDLPRVVALRERMLPGSPRRSHVAGMLEDPYWLAQITGVPPYCFVLEAVLAYLSADGCDRLLAAIATRCPGSELTLDLPRRGRLAIAAGSVLAKLLDPSRPRLHDDAAPWRIVKRIRAYATSVRTGTTPAAAQPSYELFTLRCRAR